LATNSRADDSSINELLGTHQAACPVDQLGGDRGLELFDLSGFFRCSL
jgi:hypothetical protein